jgi:hypothetical protein
MRKKKASFCLVAGCLVAWVVGCCQRRGASRLSLSHCSACRVPKIAQFIGTCSVDGLNTVGK